jgi:hypothetical protein
MTEFPFYPLLATGQVFRLVPGSQPEYMGSCALYTRRNVAVTASHCVRAEDMQYAVAAPTVPGAWVASRVIRHEESDVAVLVGDPSNDTKGPPRLYSGVDQTLTDGGDFIAVGYPADDADGAVPRYFKGNFQRYFGYSDPSAVIVRQHRGADLVSRREASCRRDNGRRHTERRTQAGE